VNSDGWLTGVVGVSGVVLIGLVLVVLRTLSQSRPPRPGSATRSPSSPPSSAAHAARGMGYLFGVVNTPRRQRSVEDNLQRAFARIDAVDPHLAERRIGMALADLGSSGDGTPADVAGPTWPTWQHDREPDGRSRREDAQ
jgi:hypothetical protein